MSELNDEIYIEPNNYERGLLENTDINQNDISKKYYLKYYWKILSVIGIFYMMPSVQFILFQVKDTSVHCYYNNKCKHDFKLIPAFNNVLSNLGYVIFGIIYIIYVYLTKRTDTKLGIHTDVSLYYSLGVALIFEGIFSSIYHLCPSTLNFQFDSTFMFVGIILMYISIFQKRHPEKIPSPIKTYIYIALLLFTNIVALSGFLDGIEIWFWTPVIILLTYLMIHYTYFLYFGKFIQINLNIIYNIRESIHNIQFNDIPKYILLLFSYSITISVGIYGIFDRQNFTDWILGTFIINLLIYFVYYITQKIYFKETISKIWIMILIIDVISLLSAIVFYNIAVSNKLLSPNESDKLNKKCVLFNYFDYHDIWHILSALGLFLLMINIYNIDKKENNIPRNQMPIF